ncbi:RBBP9/YdeN family alpha/beta hydrolase [Brachybacterium huguangmaarense]
MSTPTRAVLVHGFGATTDDHWFPWLARRLPMLERLSLPEPVRPRADVWIPMIARAIGTLDPATVVVTHSLGGIAAMRAIQSIAEGSESRLGALVLAAPFAEPLPLSGDAALDAFRADEQPRFCEGVDLEQVRASIVRAAVIRSDDDPIVPPAPSDAVAHALRAPVTVVPGGGHLLAADGNLELPPVLAAIEP